MPKNKRTKEEDAVKWFNSLDTPNEITITKEYAERWEKERTAREKPSMSTKNNSGAYDTQEPADEMRAMMGTKEGREQVAKANEMFSMMPIKKNQNTSWESTGTPRTARSSREKTAEEASKKSSSAEKSEQEKAAAKEKAAKDEAFDKFWEERNGGRRRTRKRRRKRRKTRKLRGRKLRGRKLRGRKSRGRKSRGRKSRGRKSRRRTMKRV